MCFTCRAIFVMCGFLTSSFKPHEIMMNDLTNYLITMRLHIYTFTFTTRIHTQFYYYFKFFYEFLFLKPFKQFDETLIIIVFLMFLYFWHHKQFDETFWICCGTRVINQMYNKIWNFFNLLELVRIQFRTQFSTFHTFNPLSSPLSAQRSLLRPYPCKH